MYPLDLINALMADSWGVFMFLVTIIVSILFGIAIFSIGALSLSYLIEWFGYLKNKWRG